MVHRHSHENNTDKYNLLVTWNKENTVNIDKFDVKNSNEQKF